MPGLRDELRHELHKPRDVTAFDIFPDLMGEIDRRIAAGAENSIKSIKIWMLTSLVVYIIAGVAGVTSLVYYLGQMQNQFETIILDSAARDQSLANRIRWIQRKDALDDDMIRYLIERGYEPPEWWKGRDADYTGV